jgi:dihydrofolate reductase
MDLTMTMFLSLDGVMQAPGGPDEDRSGGFDQGGWLVPHADEDMGRFVAEWFGAADGFLLGRKTYEIFAAFWPQVTDPHDPVASRLNRLPKYVASRTLDRVEWHNATLIQGNLVEEVARLKAQPGRELQVHGSGDLAQTLMKHGLIDEYRLWIYPVVLGDGRRLFREGAAPSAFKLVEARTTSTGVVVHVYRAAGKPTYGAIDLDQVDQGRRVDPTVTDAGGGS